MYLVIYIWFMLHIIPALVCFKAGLRPGAPDTGSEAAEILKNQLHKTNPKQTELKWLSFLHFGVYLQLCSGQYVCLYLCSMCVYHTDKGSGVGSRPLCSYTSNSGMCVCVCVCVCVCLCFIRLTLVMTYIYHTCLTP